MTTSDVAGGWWRVVHSNCEERESIRGPLTSVYSIVLLRRVARVQELDRRDWIAPPKGPDQVGEHGPHELSTAGENLGKIGADGTAVAIVVATSA